MTLYPKLSESIQSLSFDAIPEERKKVLRSFVAFIQSKLNTGDEIKASFICTHNSRRSQMAQIWAHTAAFYYDIEAKFYSGGLEVTEFNASAIAAMQRAGFRTSVGENVNSIISVLFSEKTGPIIAFSKLYSDNRNPKGNFAAVMTCSDAEDNCPIVSGSEVRFAIPYDDPKRYDNAPEEELRYDECSNQIAAEMFYVFSNIKME